MHHSPMVLAMGFVIYDGLSIVNQDTINSSINCVYHSPLVLAMDFVSYDGLFIASQDTINLSAS